MYTIYRLSESYLVRLSTIAKYKPNMAFNDWLEYLNICFILWLELIQLMLLLCKMNGTAMQGKERKCRRRRSAFYNDIQTLFLNYSTAKRPKAARKGECSVYRGEITPSNEINMLEYLDTIISQSNPIAKWPCGKFDRRLLCSDRVYVCMYVCLSERKWRIFPSRVLLSNCSPCSGLHSHCYGKDFKAKKVFLSLSEDPSRSFWSYFYSLEKHIL